MTLLGKTTPYPNEYDSSLLDAVPRVENRSLLGISQLPFVGFDSWHAYEVGFLLEGGCPFHTVAKIVYSAESEFIVESKSLKLYLNSLNMHVFPGMLTEAKSVATEVIEKDLSSLLQTPVHCVFHDEVSLVSDFTDYRFVESELDVSKLKCDAFEEQPDILEAVEAKAAQYLASGLLRSNCKITNQPDWGSVFVYISGDKTVTAESFLKYLVSFRQENHFHEEVCEMIYLRLNELLLPDELAVTCIYTRRGGIDICPARASSAKLLPSALGNPDILTRKTLQQ